MTFQTYNDCLGTSGIFIFSTISFPSIFSQNNQPELQRIKEDHQQEVASLQSMYSQRISQINKKHRSELEDLITENEKLANDVKDHENRSGMMV